MHKISNLVHIFEKKMSNIKFHKNPSPGSRAVPYGHTDNEANCRLSQFWERADKRSLKELLFRVAQRGVLFTSTAYKRRQQDSQLYDPATGPQGRNFNGCLSETVSQSLKSLPFYFSRSQCVLQCSDTADSMVLS